MMYVKNMLVQVKAKIVEVVKKVNELINFHEKIEKDMVYLKEKTATIEVLLEKQRDMIAKEMAEMKKVTLEIAKNTKSTKTTKTKA